MSNNKENKIEAAAEVKADVQLTLKEAAAYLQIGDFRMRSILREKLIVATKLPVKQGSKTMKWFVATSELDRYRLEHRRGFDGSYLYKVKLTEDQHTELCVLLEEAGLDIEIERANPSKKTK